MRTVLLVASLVSVSLFAATPDVGGYHVQQKIVVPGDDGWDYLTVDNAARRLYVSHGTKVDVLDADSGELKGSIPDTPGPHGIAVAPKLGRGFISCGKAAKVIVFDLTTLKTIGEVQTGQNPDAISFDKVSNRVIVSNGGSKSITVINAADATVAATLDVDGRPEVPVPDGKGLVFVGIGGKNAVFAIDAQKLTITRRLALDGCEGPGSMAMDRKNRRLFMACRGEKMAVADADSGHLITTLPICGHNDATAYDSETQLVFLSCGDGHVTVVKQSSADSYSVLETVVTQQNAKTMTLDPKTHRLFLSVGEFGPTPAPTADQPKPKPPVVPGTFRVLVVGK
jgi:DNA-binding beta-propeller fold protein YncE